MILHWREPEQLRDRARGCLLAAAQGLEPDPAADSAACHVGSLPTHIARMIAHARYLANHPDTTSESANYVQDLTAAMTSPSGTHRNRANAQPPRAVQTDAFELLQAVPVGLLAAPLPDIGRRARLAAAISSADPQRQEASVAVAYAVALAYRADTNRRVDRFDFTYQLAHLATDGALADRLARVAALGDRPPSEATQHLPADGSAPTSLAVAVAAFLRHPTDPAAAWSSPAPQTALSARASQARSLAPTRAGQRSRTTGSGGPPRPR
ncbi:MULTISPECIES: ADP-ribosylglycohydrolase family protein [Micromonospora]|nr:MULTISPECIES: ADP-ribosylglycohydrolase family protein [Micromonospora]NES16274.1 hypothetical protein [Micromonospora sp. PPF5-17B]NES39689.1 hypothetical protein [Micromonospora solifontis]NES59075.1 hypothetical protein [Micromonospora sp. PPF5-6]